MSDLVERLYALKDNIYFFNPTRMLCGEAAAHIEALEAENARLREDAGRYHQCIKGCPARYSMHGCPNSHPQKDRSDAD